MQYISDKEKGFQDCTLFCHYQKTKINFINTSLPTQRRFRQTGMKAGEVGTSEKILFAEHLFRCALSTKAAPEPEMLHCVADKTGKSSCAYKSHLGTLLRYYTFRLSVNLAPSPHSVRFTESSKLNYWTLQLANILPHYASTVFSLEFISLPGESRRTCLSSDWQIDEALLSNLALLWVRDWMIRSLEVHT